VSYTASPTKPSPGLNYSRSNMLGQGIGYVRQFGYGPIPAGSPSVQGGIGFGTKGPTASLSYVLPGMSANVFSCR